MKYELYQLNENNKDLLFLGYNPKSPVLKDNYKRVYSGNIEGRNPESALENLYCLFNMDHPEDFRGHSMSVSDVVVLDGDAWYCDVIGFTRIDFVETA